MSFPLQYGPAILFDNNDTAINITSMWKSEVQGHKYNIISGTSAEVQITLVKVPIEINLDQNQIVNYS